LSISKSIATLFHCPVCGVKYEVVGFEALPGPTTDGEFDAREGEFVLKYFLIERPRQRA
jgi:hypothetical protein